MQGDDRTRRVGELIQRELMDILRRETNDPRLQDLTVMDVRVARDLRHARVYVAGHGAATLNSDDAHVGVSDEALKALNRAAPYFRHLLGGRLESKRLPALHFEYDAALEEGDRINRLLRQLNSPKS